MTGFTIILRSERQRDYAKKCIDKAPVDGVVTISPPRRTNDQNALLWALLTDLSVAKPEGRTHTPDVWKALVMHACGHAVQFEVGLNGQPFPTGFRSSRLTVAEMSDLIEWIYAYGAEHGVQFRTEEIA